MDGRVGRPVGRRAFVGGSVAAAAAVVLGGGTNALAASASRSARALTGPVRIETGLVSGVSAALPSVTVFKGIPFAASTAGKNRWRPPQPAESWTGVRTADTFGDICPQNAFTGYPTSSSSSSASSSTAAAAALPSMSEDCLNLNVWTAAASSHERRPVLLWIYGGGFTRGYGSNTQFDGAGLAAKGLVVVTFNYRTGVFGFLAHPDLSEESGHGASGNYGLLDQIAALRWIRRNITAFGGDPDRVTVAGQSAGAGSVAFLTYSPLAAGLFHRAIAQSGVRSPRDPDIAGLPTSYRTLEYAESNGVDYAKDHGATTLKELRALSVSGLLVGNDVTDPAVVTPMNSYPPPLLRPVLDGWVVPRTIEEALDRGAHIDIPFLTGNNKDENGASPNPPTTLAKYEAIVKQQYGDMADEFLTLYPATTDAEANTSQTAAARDIGRTSTSLWATEWARRAKSPVYTYYWTHTPPGASGAGHGSEIPYVFGNLYADADTAWTDQDRQVADTMSSYWANFAATGNPNGRGIPHWAASVPGEMTTMRVGDDWGRVKDADTANLDFFRRFYAAQQAW
ncbi:carboxylesterase family protein [Streptomyces sp. NPDC047081]|uniref:carboxylesterase/lipase family protein n=1 Tax=Streptomyces sp. NPDC047081 TaxID=3154706 RepID=UPI0033C40896